MFIINKYQKKIIGLLLLNILMQLNWKLNNSFCHYNYTNYIYLLNFLDAVLQPEIHRIQLYLRFVGKYKASIIQEVICKETQKNCTSIKWNIHSTVLQRV